MPSTSFPARQARSQYRHELRTLTYVILDEANGGVIRNLNHEGAAVQAVGALRAGQRVRLRFELRFPRLRVDAWAEVAWSSPTGQCGVRFVELPARASHHIDLWIFSNLLESLAHEAAREPSIFEASLVSAKLWTVADDGLTASSAPRPAIRLQPEPQPSPAEPQIVPPPVWQRTDQSHDLDLDPGWLSRPISSHSMARLIDALVITAALLLFAVVFLSIAHELPGWPLTLAAGLAAAGLITASYCAVFAVFGGTSVGMRLARASAGEDGCEESDPEANRFR